MLVEGPALYYTMSYILNRIIYMYICVCVYNYVHVYILLGYNITKMDILWSKLVFSLQESQCDSTILKTLFCNIIYLFSINYKSVMF